MNLRRLLYRSLNALLDRMGLQIRPTEFDLDARLSEPEDLAVLFDAFAAALQPWFDNQAVLSIRSRRDIRPDIEEFYDLYLSSPFRKVYGSSRFNNQLMLFLIARAVQPPTIVDSGTFTGASAWALSMGAPQAEVFSFDIDLGRLVYRTPGVVYIERDWSTFDFGSRLDARSLVYFDDHVNQVQRLLEAVDQGVRTVVFDDDFWLGSFAAMANGGFSLPKIAFLYEPSLRDRTELRWIEGGRAHVYRLPHAEFERARSHIALYERTPNTSLITGIHQTPYTIVRTTV